MHFKELFQNVAAFVKNSIGLTQISASEASDEQLKSAVVSAELASEPKSIKQTDEIRKVEINKPLTVTSEHSTLSRKQSKKTAAKSSKK